MIVNQIDIYNVETMSFQDNKCAVNIKWKINGNLNAGYQGGYTAVLYDNKGNAVSVPVEDKDGFQCADVSFENLSCDRTYAITLEVSQGERKVCSKRANVFIGSFQNITGIFDGETLELTWELNADQRSSGVCLIDSSAGSCDMYKIDASSRIMRIKPVKTAPGQTMTVSLYISDNSVSDGLKSIVRFLTSGIHICSGEMTIQQDGTMLGLILASDYADLGNVFVAVCKDGSMLWRSEPVRLEKAEDPEGTYYSCKLLVPVSVMEAGFLKKCLVRVTAVSDGVESAVPDPADTLLLQTPYIQIQSVEKDGYVCSICMPQTERVPCGFEVSGGKKAGVSHFTLGFDQSAEVSICAKYIISGIPQCGPHIVSTVFKQGYYPAAAADGGEEICYYGSALTDSEAVIFLSDDIVGNLQEDICVSVISIKKDTGGYIFKVGLESALEPDALSSFLIEAEKKRISAYGIYMLRDILLRTARYRVQDTTALLCAMNPKQRWADICPGIGLWVTTADYMNQQSPAWGDISGFVSSSLECYPVYIQKGAGYLEFDCFAGEMAKNMSSRSSGSGANPVFVADITDFMQTGIRQPYYRVVYPAYFQPADVIESPYASDNFVILASDSYDTMLRECAVIEADPAAIGSLNIPVIIFRGRSRLSLRVKVCIGNEHTYVPVGTTVGDVLQMHGIHSESEVKMYRRNYKGEKAEVFLSLFEHPENIVLISGDNISF